MREPPGVSVVVPTYNRGDLLRRAVESILDQTFQDLEVIIVDDASTDDTPQVVAALLEDARLRCLHHSENRGGAAARNTGIEAARGTYVAFLDSDDVWRPRKLEKQYALLEKRRRSGAKNVVVYTGDVAIDRHGNFVKPFSPRERGRIRERLLMENCVGSTSAVVAPRACLERIGGFDEQLPSAQDRDLYIRLARFCLFDYVPETLLERHIGHASAKRISDNAAAGAAGTEALLRKYGRELRCQERSALARYYYYKIGIRSLRGGKQNKARRYLIEAVRLSPSPRNVAGWGMTLLGTRAYRELLRARRAARRLWRAISKRERR